MTNYIHDLTRRDIRRGNLCVQFLLEALVEPIFDVFVGMYLSSSLECEW